ncbi:MAG: hypothetical protein AB7V56_06680 [Candidatus Nitrosocosmicus sp.]
MTDRLPISVKRRLDKDLKKHYKLILSTLYENINEKFNKNKLVEVVQNKGKQIIWTGSGHKSNSLDAIQTLIDAGLALMEREGKQKMNITLTPSGKQLCKIISSIDKYNTSFSKFHDRLIDNIFCIPDYILMSLEIDDLSKSQKDGPNLYEEVENARLKLISKGWKNKEVKYYNEFRFTLLLLYNIFDKNFIYLIIYRFAKLKQQHDQNESQTIVRNIVIKGLIMESIENKIDYLISNQEQVFLGRSYVKHVDPTITRGGIMLESMGSILQYYVDIQDTISQGLIAPMMKNEVSRMILCYLDLLEPSLINLDLKLQEITDKIKYLKGLKDITEYQGFKIYTLEQYMSSYHSYCKVNDYKPGLIG